ncbi:MAG: iron transporter substrate-binding protein [Proteobacteria bacterium]|nr:iron transporter substrate-binding protein [Pseudomonadota bacterium]
MVDAEAIGGHGKLSGGVKHIAFNDHVVKNPVLRRGALVALLMSPTGQATGGRANSLRVPANKTFKPDPRIPLLDDVRLIKYDFEKYGKAAEHRRLLDRWTKEVESRRAEPDAQRVCPRNRPCANSASIVAMPSRCKAGAT